MKKRTLLLLLLALAAALSACRAAPSLFEKTTYPSYEGNRVKGVSVVKEEDLFYRYVNGKKTGEGYKSLTSANSVYTVYAYLENPQIVLFDLYLGQKPSGEWILLSDGEELLLPSGGEWSFSMPYLIGKKTVTTAEGETEKQQTYYSVISLYALSSSLSKVEQSAIVAPYCQVVSTADFNGDEMYESIALKGEDGVCRVYDAFGNTLFASEELVQHCKKQSGEYFITYSEQTQLYSLYSAQGEVVLSGATFLQNSEEIQYFVAAYKGENGALTYRVAFGNKVFSLAEDTTVITAAESHILYAKKAGGGKYAYYLYNGAENRLLPYEVVTASSYGDAYLAYETETSTTVDVLDRTLTPVFKGLPEDVQISPLSEPQKGILCFYSESEAKSSGVPTLRFLTPNGSRTVFLFGGAIMRSTELSGYYEVSRELPSGGYETHVYNVLTDTCSRSFDALALRYENGIKYILGISYAENVALVLDGVSFKTAFALPLKSVKSAVIKNCYTEEFLIAQTAENNAMPLTALSVTEGETTSYFALYREAAYGEAFDSAPLKVVKIADAPQFSAAGNLLVVGEQSSTVYRVEPQGLTHLFHADRAVTGAFNYGSQTYYLYQEEGKTGVINALNEVLIPALYDGVAAQVEGALSLKQGETYVLAILGNSDVSYPAENLSSLELYADGFAVGVNERGVATLYQNGKRAAEEPLISSNIYYDIQVQKNGALTVRRLYAFIFEDGTRLSTGEPLSRTYPPVCSIGSFGDEFPAPFKAEEGQN